ncbi:TOG array regulator of axonemal microtubules protein 1-like isoform X2 [Tubulanus polymorphus]|uniref:TOG array regulator of axonemal microtubules protein 1-like isoform X2 n=1 Tax=Tubulanus polymorphus TaxID=672921 RepID=UPI003DA60FBC
MAGTRMQVCRPLAQQPTTTTRRYLPSVKDDALLVNSIVNGINYRDMEENMLIHQLSDVNYSNKAELLDNLRTSVRRNGGRLPISDQMSAFKAFSMALMDSGWEIRHKCVQLIHELIPQLGEDLDNLMAVLLPKLVPNLGDKTTAVRRAVIQTLHVYMKHTYSIYSVFHAIVQHGLESDVTRIKKQSVEALPMLFTPEFCHEDFFEIAQSLTRRLVDNSTGDNTLQDIALLSLEKIRELVGNDVFNSYINKLSPPLKSYYTKLTNQENGIGSDESHHHAVVPPQKANSTNYYEDDFFDQPSYRDYYSDNPDHSQHNHDHMYSSIDDRSSGGNAGIYYSLQSYEFGIVPSHIMNQLEDQENFRKRAQAVEELRNIVQDLRGTSALQPHILSFISFLNNLLDDSNFKITTVTLDIIALLVNKLSLAVKPHLKHVVTVLTKRMGDNKIVVRSAIMRVVMQLMHILSPKPVLTVICENLLHRNSRVRQETLNIVISSLLTFPSVDFDLPALCETIAPTLVDAKRQVRQAALESFAVLAQAMGAGKLGPLVQAVDNVELGYDGEGVMAAVQARLARRQLPRLNTDGLVDYATPAPTSATTRGATVAPQGADIDWIMAASGGMGSARSSVRSSESIELESVSGSARSTPVNVGPTPRRFYSAGRGKTKLPWEEEDERVSTSVDHPTTAPAHQSRDEPTQGPPLVPKNTWGNSDSPKSTRRSSRKQEKVDSSIDHPIPNTSSGTPNSYKQIYLSKIRRGSDGGKVKKTDRSDNPLTDRGLPLGVPSTPNKKILSIDDLGDNVNSFSNSYWPEDNAKPYRKILDPIQTPDSGLNSDWSEQGTDNKGENDVSPVPLKPTLVRSSSSRRAKVPPIRGSPTAKGEDDSAYSPSIRSSRNFNSTEKPHEEIDTALKQIRNSASKKRAEKLFEKLEKQNSKTSDLGSPSSSPPPLPSPQKNTARKSESVKKNEPSTERKPQPRVSNPQERDTSSLKTDYSALSGATFRENPNSDVKIVGRGFNDELSSPDNKSSTDINRSVPVKESSNNSKAREKRRVQKGVVSTQSRNSSSIAAEVHDDDRLNVKQSQSKDQFNIVGRGMFDTQSNASASMANLNGDRGERRSKSDNTAPLSGVVGIKVKQDSFEDQDPDSDEDVLDMAMSRTLRESLAKKKQQKEEAELLQQQKWELEQEERRQKLEEQRKLVEEERKKAKERQQSRLRRLSGSSSRELGLEPNPLDLSISGNSSQQQTTPSPSSRGSDGKPPAPTPRKRQSSVQPGHSTVSPQSTSRQLSMESDSQEELKPFKKPEEALRDAQRFIQQEDWETKCSAMNNIRRLAVYHPNVLTQSLHAVVVALTAEVKNLRSQVSRLAITTFAELFSCLKKAMDSDLDNVTKILLAKSGDSNSFIREDVEKALKAMVDNVTPQRALSALINGGASHKNVAVRRTTAQVLCEIIEKMGPGRILSGIKDVTDRVLPTTGQFITDGSPETRYYGRRIFYMLMSHQDFNKMLNKHVQGPTLRNVQDVIENLRTKGLGDKPVDSTSARSRRSGQGTRSGSLSRGSSASSGIDGLASAGHRPKRTDDATLEEIKEMNGQLSANDWKDRYKGIQRMLDMVENNTDVVGNNIVKIYDRFMPRLQDSNSKVNLFALQTQLQLIPLLKDYLPQVINMLIPNVANNLSSKNKDIYTTAVEILDGLVEYMDGSVLLSPFVNLATQGNPRIKPDMVEKVSYLVPRVYSRKQKHVVNHVFPLVWSLLGSATGSGAVHGATGNIHKATAKLVNSLYAQMGQSFLDHASSNPNITGRNLKQLQDMIDNPP